MIAPMRLVAELLRLSATDLANHLGCAHLSQLNLAVAEGRDIGAVVWPDAELKVWLDADPAVRVRRRGGEGADALERDRRDAAQTIVPDGSFVVDTSGLSIEQVVERIAERVR